MVTHFKSVVILVLTAKVGDPRAHAVNTAGKNKGQKKRQTVFFSGVKIQKIEQNNVSPKGCRNEKGVSFNVELELLRIFFHRGPETS